MKAFFEVALAAALAVLIPFSSPGAKEPKKYLPLYPPSHESFLGSAKNPPSHVRVFCTIQARCDLDGYIEQTGVCALLVIEGRERRIEKYNSKDICEGGKNGREKDYGIASMAKSLTSTLVGQVLADRFHLRTRSQFQKVLERKVGSFLTLADRMKLADGYADVTMDDLLSMRSNIQWRETDFPALFSDSVYYDNQVRLPPRKQTLLDFAARYHPVRERQEFHYSALDAAMAIAVVKNIVPARPPLKEFEKGVWAMMGAAHEAEWNVDINGDPTGPCCFKARIDDLARFGRFALEKGNGRGIPSAWFDLATSPSDKSFEGLGEENDHADPSCELGYGYYWWLRRHRTDYFAFGRLGQFIHVYPEADIVIVQLSDWNSAPANDHARCIALKSHDAIVESLQGKSIH